MEKINKDDIVFLNVYLNDENEGTQQLFAHKKCLRSRINERVPTIFDPEE
jgi:hypothetical protein